MAADNTEPKTTPYTWYSVSLLMAIYTVSLIDRKVPFILVESIKQDLHLSDTQIGLISGAVFTLTYSIAGIPIARLADLSVRKNVIVGSLLVWSVLTSFGGFAQNFWQLAIARMGVAIGESGATPAAHSIIADIVPKSRRAFAIGLYMTGAPIGILIGLSVGGIINDLASWRVAMIVLGIPGIILSVLVLTTLREPQRRPEAADKVQPNVLTGLGQLFAQPVFRQLFLGGLLFSASTGAMLAFTPAFIIRTYHLSASQTGLTYGLLAGISGAVGALAGGALNDRLQTWDIRAGLWLVAACLAISTPLLAIAFSVHTYPLFLLCLFIPQATGMIYAGPSFSAVQSVFNSRLHAYATAVFLFALNGIGLSLGPLIAGMLSDFLTGLGHQDTLKTALFLLAFGKIWAAVHYLLAANALRRTDPDRAQAGYAVNQS